MEESLKQRLVGAAVLAALAVIFLPALFDKDERVSIDTTSQIPPAPVIEPVTIPQPTKPQGVKVPPAEELFQPKVVDQPKVDESKKVSSAPAEETVVKNDTPKPKTEAKPKPKEKVVSQPGLNNKGVPAGWVVQAASFKSSESANNFTRKLQKAGYKAYSQAVKTDKGEFFRVFIGPYIEEKKAIDTKRTIDKTYKLSSRVLRFNPASGD